MENNFQYLFASLGGGGKIKPKTDISIYLPFDIKDEDLADRPTVPETTKVIFKRLRSSLPAYVERAFLRNRDLMELL